MLSDHLTRVRHRIEQACQRCDRDPASVTIVAVTKGVPAETVREAVALGLMDLGENRVQEAREKQNALGSGFGAQGRSPQPTGQPAPAIAKGGPGSPERVRWHLVGHLQRNKAKDAVALFDVIHSVDSARLTDVLEHQVAEQGRDALEVFIQVNLSGEATKFGCREDDIERLARHVIGCPHLRLSGLMTLAPYAEESEQSRPYFRRLRELRNALHPAPSTQHPALKLSMGMSQDFEVAIEEGADFVRIGTALFGERD